MYSLITCSAGLNSQLLKLRVQASRTNSRSWTSRIRLEVSITMPHLTFISPHSTSNMPNPLLVKKKTLSSRLHSAQCVILTDGTDSEILIKCHCLLYPPCFKVTPKLFVLFVLLFFLMTLWMRLLHQRTRWSSLPPSRVMTMSARLQQLKTLLCP